MHYSILEISNKDLKGGRVPIKIALHKIHSDPKETNKNGIHWKLEYVKSAIDSANMIPICAEFIDPEDKEVPYGHGLTGSMINDKGLEEPDLSNSDVVGVIDHVEIETFKNDKDEYEMLVGSGYLYNQRYPKFVQWVRNNFATNCVESSIEIVGLPENDNKIIYEEDEPTEEFRTPMEYLYSGTALLSIEPADDDAVVLEISQKQNKKKEEDLMDWNMDEVKSEISKTISELSNKDAAHAQEVQSLNDKISELNEQIANKDAALATKDEQISELNASVATIQKALDQMKSDQETWWKERDILETELAKAKVAEKLAELDDALGEFNESEIEVAKEDIIKLKEEISACKERNELNNVSAEINSIKSKICMNIVAQQKAAEKAKTVETNSHEEVSIDDIFSEMCMESPVIDDDIEDLNIF